MILNEFINEDAAVEWFGKVGYAPVHGPHIALCAPATDRDDVSEVVVIPRSHVVIRLPIRALRAYLFSSRTFTID